MKFNSPLREGTITKRYKRFLSDVILDGEQVVAHVPNTGSMESCWAPDWKCAVSKSDNPERKLPFTLELTHNGESWIGVNTGNANKLAREIIESGLVHSLTGYSQIQAEKKISKETRLDYFLSGHPSEKDCYIEVKNVTLKHKGEAQFPDSVTERGQKHLGELLELKKQGHRAAMLFVVQREDVEIFSPAEDFDPAYSKLLKEVVASGVEIYVVRCKLSTTEIKPDKLLPVSFL